MRTVLFAALAAGLGLASPAIAQHHDHHPPPAAAQAEAPAQRFATDPVLRENMRGIRKSVDALAHYDHGHIGPKEVAMLAGNVEGHVDDIIANCKLPPDADAALHAVIVPLKRNAAELKADPTRMAPAAAMRESLAQYRRQFDDPGLDADD